MARRRLLGAALVLGLGGWGAGAAEAGLKTEVPGRWGTTDSSNYLTFRTFENRYIFKDHEIWWAGVKDVRAQWLKILPNHIDAENGNTWYYGDHAKAEPPHNVYFRWDYDKPMPEGTRILLEGDFPYARYFSICMGAPTDMPRQFPPPPGWASVTGDGGGLAEIVIADVDIVPDPGSINPFIPGADRTAKNRHYHLTFELRNGNAAALNTFSGHDVTTPPHRAPGNLRVGGTFKFNRNSEKIDPTTGKPFGYRGSYIWVRYTLPDRFDKYAGVKPPVIRIQFPGEEPVLAPITREIPTSEAGLLDPYGIADNPALGDADGRSKKEFEGYLELQKRAMGSVGAAGARGARHLPMIWEVFNRRHGREVLPEPELTLNVGDPGYSIRWLTLYQDWRQGKYPADKYLGWGFTKRVAELTYERYGVGAGRPPPRNRIMGSDHNVQTSYVQVPVSIGAGKLVVITGKAPRTPRTLHGNARMEEADLRYWNLTLQGGGDAGNNRLRLTAVGDLIDEDVVLDKNRRYMIVIGADEDRPANATAENGITWRRWPLGNMLNLLWRFLDTDGKWPNRPNQITWEQADYYLGDPPGSGTTNRALLRKTMAEYYPSPRYSTKAEVETLITDGRTGLEFPLSQIPAPIAPLEPARLDVSIETPSAVRAGARVRLDYGPWLETLAGKTVSAGKHIVDFRDADGSITPNPQIVEARPGKPTRLSIAYSKTNGEWVAAPGNGRERFPDGGLECAAVAGDQLIVTGGFSRINRVSANNVAAFYDGRWHALGSGLDGKAEGIVAYDGGVAVGGWFQKPGKYVAYWKGDKWRELGGGMDAGVRALAVHGGTLYAGGEFTEADGRPAAHIARWDGSSWKALGAGTGGTLGIRTGGRDGPGWVYALTSFNGNLVVAGNFTEAGGVTAHNAAQWDAKSGAWAPLGGGLNSRVYAFATYRGELYATGDFTHAGDTAVNYIARWDGRSWKPVSTGLWDLHGALGRTLLVAGDKLMVGGGFRTAGGVAARNAALWDGTSFGSMGKGLNRYVESSALYDGKIIAVGWFNHMMEGGPTGWAQWEPK